MTPPTPTDALIPYKDVMEALRKFGIRLKRDRDIARKEIALAVIGGAMTVITHLKEFNCTMHNGACREHEEITK